MKKEKNKALFLLTLGLLLLLSLPVCVNAKTKRSGWYTDKSKNTYYYTKKGKKTKGLVTIGKYRYYFDSNGIQRYGWQKIGNSYYYFRIAGSETPRKRYCVSDKTVNGIYLKKNGKASQSDSAKKRKLALMYRANKLIQSITTNKMTKTEKLRAAFEQARKLKAYNRGGFQHTSHWDVFYAEIAFNTGRADCYSFAAYFAYLANAIGYKASCVSSGGHGWAEVNGKVYDPNWSKVDKRHNYFGMDYSKSGKGGRPNYARNRRYIKKI